MQEECGIVGISSSDTLPFDLYYSLYALQHRGQESAGISTYHEGEMELKREMGLVAEAFGEKDLNQLQGNSGIGHVRYSTSGKSRIENSQPLLVSSSEGELSIGHNGHIVNSNKIRKELEEEGHVFTTGNDSEIIAHLLSKNYTKYKDIVKAIKKSMDELRGSYSLILLWEGKIIGVRDPYGIKPLCYGKTSNGYMVTSESVALDTIGAKLIDDVAPGQIVIADEDNLNKYTYRKEGTAHCFFEHVYFARPDSKIDGKLNYDCRFNIGKKLGENYPVEEADLVSPVPDSGITFAIGYSEATGITYKESLMKNRYVGRTFIMPGQEMRETAVRLKMNPVESNVKGKKIVLIDDSIVRGTTSTQIIKQLKKKGAKEVHLRIGAPPIRFPCHLGIDMATEEELIANNNEIKDIEKQIGADSLNYIGIDELIEALNIKKQKLCLGCLTGEYPV
ncbi:MAG: Glutamine phosphoribosylpyrophosphate amidotransferase PurF [Candidatus Methanohalarchaeum thermophilum]|uniref:Amidophosphoribosyltransferase n=1 Tax=Methanohalarchaeum thermophilum TaxID=1903181 RepID=A0A1Q6DXX2_METT1|nr:MAG: Glutamine phosphoribosylpyrophosphate amidotransferase PurF [Candidatus Methanohalarchaeum thermophilum]